MNVTENCYPCLRGLIDKTVALSGGNGSILSRSMELLDDLWARTDTPPAIANRLLAYIQEATGSDDPFASSKAKELERVGDAVARSEGLFDSTLEGALKYSSLGNSTDFFVDDGFEPKSFRFFAALDIIEEEIYIRSNEVLILGDNVGDFFFDVRLMRFLAGLGKRVFYAVKEEPVQNDLSLKEVAAYGLRGMWDNIISTGASEVGIRKAQIQGLVKDLWEGNAMVIAKGMGNYETISEFNTERCVIHIMKVKCQAVAEHVGHSMGSYIAITGGERYGR